MQLAILGYGKMGKTIERIAKERGHSITLKATSENRDEVLQNLSAADAAVEFTEPGAAYQNITACFEAGLPVVSGTTGWSEQLEKARQECIDNDQAFFYASNFSIGMNIVFALNKQLAQWMDQQPQYDVALSETHHNEKKDAPSGTAETLANDVVKLIKRKEKWTNKVSEDDEERYPSPSDPSSSLKVTSYRKKGVPGIHQIIYNSVYDNIEVKHTAHSRDGFALGAVLAAEWLKDKKGCFGMEDLLKL